LGGTALIKIVAVSVTHGKIKRKKQFLENLIEILKNNKFFFVGI